VSAPDQNQSELLTLDDIAERLDVPRSLSSERLTETESSRSTPPAAGWSATSWRTSVTAATRSSGGSPTRKVASTSFVAHASAPKWSWLDERHSTAALDEERR
jgi:hypothetical protein